MKPKKICSVQIAFFLSRQTNKSHLTSHAFSHTNSIVLPLSFAINGTKNEGKLEYYLQHTGHKENELNDTNWIEMVRDFPLKMPRQNRISHKNGKLNTDSAFQTNESNNFRRLVIVVIKIEWQVVKTNWKPMLKSMLYLRI